MQHILVSFTEIGEAFTLTGSIGSKASCLAFLAGLAAGAFIPPSGLPGLLAGALEGTAGADSTIVAAAAGTALTRTGNSLLYLCITMFQVLNPAVPSPRLTKACSDIGASYSQLILSWRYEPADQHRAEHLKACVDIILCI